MAVSAHDVDTHAQAAREDAATLEAWVVALLAEFLIARATDKDADGGWSVAAAQAGFPVFLARLRTRLAREQRNIPTRAAQVVSQAYTDAWTAHAEVFDHPAAPLGGPDLTEPVTTLTDAVTTVHQGLAQAAPRIYQQVIDEATTTGDLRPRVTSEYTYGDFRRDAAARALTKHVGPGLTLTDKRGRAVDVVSYIETVTRTAARDAGWQAIIDLSHAAGSDLVQVTKSAIHCAMCEPWQGQVLSLTGAPAPAGVHVKGTLAQARAAGLGHHNCYHGLEPYFVGITAPAAEPPPVNGTAADRTKQRRLERDLRAWLRAADLATDPTEKKQARAKVRLRRAQLRDLCERTGLPRIPWRERLGTAR